MENCAEDFKQDFLQLFSPFVFAPLTFSIAVGWFGGAVCVLNC